MPAEKIQQEVFIQRAYGVLIIGFLVVVATAGLFAFILYKKMAGV